MLDQVDGGIGTSACQPMCSGGFMNLRVTNPTKSRRRRSATEPLAETRFRRGCGRVGYDRQSMFSRSFLFVGTMVASVLVMVATAAPASAAAGDPLIPAASCGKTLNPKTGSAHAHWDVTCKN